MLQDPYQSSSWRYGRTAGSAVAGEAVQQAGSATGQSETSMHSRSLVVVGSPTLPRIAALHRGRRGVDVRTRE